MSGRGTPAQRGRLITIEGPEGGGKTTQAERLRRHLESRGVPVTLTREPGGTWLGERLREVLLPRTETGAPHDALTDALLFNAARRQLVTEVIRPALADGRTVVCARFSDSTMAYQGFGAGVPVEQLRGMEVLATDGLRPDLTILLDLPVESGLARKAPGDMTRFEAEFDLEFHERVRAGFQALARDEPDRFVIVDAEADMEAVASIIASAVDLLHRASEPECLLLRTPPMSDTPTPLRLRVATVTDDADRSVLIRVSNGELNALDELYERYKTMAYSIAYRITNDATLAEDVVQDAFLGAWRNAERYIEGRGSVKTWLLSIVHHRAIDAVRRRRPTTELPEFEAVPPPALRAPDVWSEVAASLDAVEVRAALGALSGVQREAIELAYFSGLTQQEIAERTGTPLGTVKSRMRLGLLAMRNVMTMNEGTSMSGQEAEPR